MSIVTRTCTTCKVARPLADFYIDAEARGARRTGKNRVMPCRYCAKETAQARRAPRQEYIDRIKRESGCADCGLHPEVLAVLEFDHRPGEVKKFYISKMMTSGTWEAFKTEVAKCDVVCANCHRVRTITRKQLGRFFGGTRITKAQVYKDQLAGNGHIWTLDQMLSLTAAKVDQPPLF